MTSCVLLDVISEKLDGSKWREWGRLWRLLRSRESQYLFSVIMRSVPWDSAILCRQGYFKDKAFDVSC